MTGRTGVLRLPAEIRFGWDARGAVPGLAAAIGRRVAVVADPFLAGTEHFRAMIEAIQAAGAQTAVITDVPPELPTAAVQAAAAALEDFAPEVIVGYGGGSALDAAKLVALLLTHPGPLDRYYGENAVPGPVIPLIAVPTTAGTGSEVTPVAVVSDPAREVKVGISSPHLIPAFAVVDPALSMTAPRGVTAHAGIDAFVHAVESYTAAGVNRIDEPVLPVFLGSNVMIEPLALEAAALIHRSLPRALDEPDDRGAREDMARASLLAGMAFGSGGTHLSHAMQYPIGAVTHTPHGLGTGMLLPYVLQACLPAITGRLVALGVALGLEPVGDESARAQATVDAIAELCGRIGLPTSLAELGVEPDDRARVVALSLQARRLAGIAPVPADEALVGAIFDAALAGERSLLAGEGGPGRAIPPHSLPDRIPDDSDDDRRGTVTLTPITTQPISALFIGGRWQQGSAGETFPVIDPANGEVIADFPAATSEDCAAAVDAAAAAFPAWSQTSPRRRSEILYQAFEILREEKELFAQIMVRENGKSWSDAIGEAVYAMEFFRWFAEEAVRVTGDFRLSPAGDKRIVVARQAIGVALLITPWNFPAAMATRKLGPALAAGCTTVLKPARETPLTAAYIVDVLRRAGVPDGVVNLVTPVPTGPLVAEMIAHPAVRKLSFTGSTEVGRDLLRECADTVVSTSMELGGNAPVIVLPGADLDKAVEGAMLAKMRNGGSACTAANRFYVHSSLRAEFVERMAAGLRDIRTGSGLDPENGLGALVSLAERDKVATLVEGAVREGAHVVVGGRALPGGAFYAPTLIDGVSHGDTITRTEIFGPVTAVVSYDDVDRAVEMANDTEYGLVGYVFGPEADALRVALRLETGMVAVNRGVLSDPAAPFGGTKQSGLGREGSSEGILEYLEEKYIALDV